MGGKTLSRKGVLTAICSVIVDKVNSSFPGTPWMCYFEVDNVWATVYAPGCTIEIHMEKGKIKYGVFYKMTADMDYTVRTFVRLLQMLEWKNSGLE